MTDSAATQPPGWYHAQGDPAGTQRYWDGAQWVGGPQAAQDSAAVQPAGGGFNQPAFGAVSAGTGQPASYGSRVVAVLIDGIIAIGLALAFLVVGFVVGFASDTLGAIIILVGAVIALVAFPIWNSIVRQGQTGQTIGKTKQNIRLIADASSGPIGIGPAIVRYVLGGLLTSLCYLDVLFPLFDEQKKRLTDKILNLSVVDA